MKLHLRINAHAKVACRQVLGRNMSVSKGVKRIEERSDVNQRKQKARGRRKYPKRYKEDSHGK